MANIIKSTAKYKIDGLVFNQHPFFPASGFKQFVHDRGPLYLSAGNPNEKIREKRAFSSGFFFKMLPPSTFFNIKQQFINLLK